MRNCHSGRGRRSRPGPPASPADEAARGHAARLARMLAPEQAQFCCLMVAQQLITERARASCRHAWIPAVWNGSLVVRLTVRAAQNCVRARLEPCWPRPARPRLSSSQPRRGRTLISKEVPRHFEHGDSYSRAEAITWPNRGPTIENPPPAESAESAGRFREAAEPGGCSLAVTAGWFRRPRRHRPGDRSGSANGRRTLQIDVNGRGLALGRDEHLNWTLPDGSRIISGKHCAIRFEEGGYWLHDVSTNGTFVNGSPHRLNAPYLLRDGDRLNIGPYIIAVSVQGGQEAGRTTAPVSSAPAPGEWEMFGRAAPPGDRAGRPVHASPTGLPDLVDFDPFFEPPKAPRSDPAVQRPDSWPPEPAAPPVAVTREAVPAIRRRSALRLLRPRGSRRRSLGRGDRRCVVRSHRARCGNAGERPRESRSQSPCRGDWFVHPPYRRKSCADVGVSANRKHSCDRQVERWFAGSRTTPSNSPIR